MMAAVAAAQAGAKVCVLERNSALGRKLLLTGGGRCNLTHGGTVEGLVQAYGHCGRFLRHALHIFGPDAVMRFFAERQVPCTIEQDGCVFPAVHRATDVCRTLYETGRDLGVQYLYSRRVEAITRIESGFELHTTGQTVQARTVIIAAGGASWPQTGSDGDGWRLAKEFGHTLIPPRAAVCPVVAAESWVGQLQGVALEDAALKSTIGGKKIAARGALVFTANGLGGPAVFDLSREVTDTLFAGRGPVAIVTDLVPTLTIEQLDAELVAQSAAHAKRRAFTVLAGRMPRALAMLLLSQIEPSPSLLAGQITRQQRRKLTELVKSLPLTITATAPLAQATVTRGGVALDEIDPKTMQSHKCPGLFFAGETLNADGPCGGYNLQIAWATGVLAGRSAAQLAASLSTA